MNQIDQHTKEHHFHSCVSLPSTVNETLTFWGSIRASTHNLGFRRIGAKRELKFAPEPYWKRQPSRDELKAAGADPRQ